MWSYSDIKYTIFLLWPHSDCSRYSNQRCGQVPHRHHTDTAQTPHRHRTDTAQTPHCQTAIRLVTTRAIHPRKLSHLNHFSMVQVCTCIFKALLFLNCFCYWFHMWRFVPQYECTCLFSELLWANRAPQLSHVEGFSPSMDTCLQPTTFD